MKPILILLLAWWIYVLAGTLAISLAWLLYRIGLLRQKRRNHPHPQLPFLLQPHQPVADQPPEDEFARRLREAVNLNLANPAFSVAILARSLHLSEDTLLRKTKALTGKTPVELIRHFRLARARRLLRETRRTISEIALESGFNSPNSFCRVFKQEEGQTPSRWREAKTKQGE